MKIWIVEIGEPLPVEVNVRLHRYGEFSRFLAAQGHEVIWWTSTFSHVPKKNFFESDTELVIDKVKMKFLYGSGYSRNVSFTRIEHHKNFAEKFKKQALNHLKIEKPDLIISPIPTIAVARACSDICDANEIPHVIDIRDYWPDEIANLAPKPFRFISRFFLRTMYSDMKKICLKASSIMGNSQVSIDYGLKFTDRIQSDFDHVFPLGYSDKKYSENDFKEEEQWFNKLNLKSGSFKVCFFGTIGRFFDLDLVIQAARSLSNSSDTKGKFEFIIAGDGDYLEKYKNLAKDVESISFTGWLDAKKIQVIMKNSHIGLAPYVITSDFAMPNKIFEYMSGSLGVVSSIQLELPIILEENNCGITYSGKSSDELAQILINLEKAREKNKVLGQNARALFEREFKMESVFTTAESHLEKMVIKA